MGEFDAMHSGNFGFGYFAIVVAAVVRNVVIAIVVAVDVTVVVSISFISFQC